MAQRAKKVATDTSESTLVKSKVLASQFHCSVCKKYVLPPVMQCHNGHLICVKCRVKIPSCPTCHGPMVDHRNMAMERVASQLLFPCLNQEYGCVSHFVYNTLGDHQDSCPYRQYRCPMPESACQWHGAVNEILTHLQMGHNTKICDESCIVCHGPDIARSSTVDWIRLRNFEGYHFVVVVQKQQKIVDHPHFIVFVIMMATPDQARKYSFHLQLDDGAFRFTQIEKTISIYDCYIKNKFESKQLLITPGNVKEFTNEEGNLIFKLTLFADDKQNY